MSNPGKAEAQAPASEAVADEKPAVTAEAEAPESEAAETEEAEESESPTEKVEGVEGAEASEDESDDKPTKSKLRREKQKARISELEESVKRLTEQAQAADRTKPAATDLGPKPDRSKYDDEAEYAADLAAWKVEEKIIARQTKAHETTTTTVRGDAAAKRVELFRERAMALTDRYPDIEAKVFKDDSLPMSATMADTIMESEKGPEIAYYLSSNRETAQRIKSMTPLAAAMELGRIEAKLSLPKPRTETKAPPPPPTLKGSTSGPAKKLDDMSMAEYRKARGYD